MPDGLQVLMLITEIAFLCVLKQIIDFKTHCLEILKAFEGQANLNGFCSIIRVMTPGEVEYTTDSP